VSVLTGPRPSVVTPGAAKDVRDIVNKIEQQVVQLQSLLDRMGGEIDARRSGDD